MLFGLQNASQSYQRYIFRALRDLDFVFLYMDDVLFFSSTVEEHEIHLRTVFERLKQAGLRLNLSKCEFGKSKINFLGHFIERFATMPRQSASLIDFPVIVVQLRSFPVW